MESTTGTNTTKAKAIGKKILQGAGLIVVLGAVVWVGAQGFKNSGNIRAAVANAIAGIQSIFTPAERIVLSIVDSQLVVDEPFVVAWEHRGNTSEGSYEFSYECKDGVYLSLKTGSQATDTVFCNIAVPIQATDTVLTLTAHGDITGVVDIPVRIAYTQNGETRVHREGTLVLPIQDIRFDTATSTDATPVVPETPSNNTPVILTPGATTTTVIRIGTTPNLFGKADLTVKFLAIGLVDRRTGEFQEKDELPRKLPSGKRAAIQFEVVNKGTNVAQDDWRFSVSLPTSPAYTYKSGDQPSLFPDDRMLYTIGFDRVKNADEDDYSIRIDIDDDINESSESNNTESGEVEIDR